MKYKFEDLIGLLDPEVQEKIWGIYFDGLFLTGWQDKEFSDLSDFICTLFIWRNTPEGHDYWYGLYLRFYGYVPGFKFGLKYKKHKFI